jgi:hypothetical protein
MTEMQDRLILQAARLAARIDDAITTFDRFDFYDADCGCHNCEHVRRLNMLLDKAIERTERRSTEDPTVAWHYLEAA